MRAAATICGGLLLFAGHPLPQQSTTPPPTTPPAQTPATAQPPPAPPKLPFAERWSQSFDADAPLALVAGLTVALVSGANTPTTVRRASDGALVDWSTTLRADLPIVAGDGLFFLASARVVHALDETTGRERWATPDLDVPVQSIAYFPGGLIATTGRTISAYRTLDGGRVWSAALEAEPATPAATHEDHVYVGLRDGSLVSLDRNTGATVWRTGGLLSAPGPLVPQGDQVYYATPQGYVCAFRAATGVQNWCYQVHAAPIAAPLVKDRDVYVALIDNTVQAFRTTSGAQLWRVQLPDRPSTIAPPVLVDTHLLVPFPDGRVLRLDLASKGRRSAAIPAPTDADGAPTGALLDGFAAAPDGSLLYRLTVADNGTYSLAAFAPSGG